MELPADILAAAKDAVFDFDCDWTADGRRRGEQQEQEAVAIVARAILAERLSATERAAKIAEDRMPATMDTWSDAIADVCADIAAAIRSRP